SPWTGEGRDEGGGRQLRCLSGLRRPPHPTLSRKGERESLNHYTVALSASGSGSSHDTALPAPACPPALQHSATSGLAPKDHRICIGSPRWPLLCPAEWWGAGTPAGWFFPGARWCCGTDDPAPEYLPAGALCSPGCCNYR